MARLDKGTKIVTVPTLYNTEMISQSLSSGNNVIRGTTAATPVIGLVSNGNILADMAGTSGYSLMYPYVPPEDVSEEGVPDAESIPLSYYYRALSEQISKLGEKQDTHDIKTTEEHQQLLEKMNLIETENTYFREQIAASNTPKKLEKYSISLGVLSIISIGISKIFSVDMLNPILAYMMFGICVVFYVMAIIMNKQDES
jgi:hypothetical protein